MLIIICDANCESLDYHSSPFPPSLPLNVTLIDYYDINLVIHAEINTTSFHNALPCNIVTAMFVLRDKAIACISFRHVLAGRHLRGIDDN